MLSLGSGLVAAVVLVVELTAIVLVSVRLARRISPASGAGLERATVGLLLALVQIVAVIQVLGIATIISRWSVLALHVLVAVVVLKTVDAAPRLATRSRRISPAGVVTGLIGLGFGALAVALSLSGRSLESDTAQYHLPNAAFWMRTGSLWNLPLSIPGYFTNGYPSNGEITGLWLMLPTHDDTLAYLAPIVFGVLCVLGTALLARELRGRAWPGALAAICFLASPISFSTQVHSLMTDLLAAGGVVTGVALALVAVHRRGEQRWVVLAGLALGLGVGAKDPALLPAIGAVVMFIVLIPRRRRLADGLIMVGSGAALSAFWFIRDWIVVGNPIFPKGVAVAGHTLFVGAKGPLTVYKDSMAYHVLRGHAHIVGNWATLARQLYGPVLIILALGSLVALWRVVHPQLAWWEPPAADAEADGPRRDPVVVAVVILAAFSFLAYLATPYTGGGPTGVPFLIASQLRYAFPFVLMAAAMAVFMPRLVLVIIAVPTLIYDLYKVVQGPSFRPDLNVNIHAVAGALGIALVVLAAIGVTSWSRARHGQGLRPRAVGGLVGAAALVVAGGLVLSALPGPGSSDPVGLALAMSGQSRGTVLLVGLPNVRNALGPHLDHHLSVIGDGPSPHDQPVGSAAELNQKLAQMNPAVIVVGLGPSPGKPSGWQPPSGWAPAFRDPASVVYARLPG